MMLAAGFRPHLHAIGMGQFRPASVMSVRHTIGDRPPHVRQETIRDLDILDDLARHRSQVGGRIITAAFLKLFEQPWRPGIHAADFNIVLNEILKRLPDQRAGIAHQGLHSVLVVLLRRLRAEVIGQQPPTHAHPRRGTTDPHHIPPSRRHVPVQCSVTGNLGGQVDRGLNLQRAVAGQRHQVFPHETDLIGQSGARHIRRMGDRPFGGEANHPIHLDLRAQRKAAHAARYPNPKPAGRGGRHRPIDRFTARLRIPSGHRRERDAVGRSLDDDPPPSVNPDPIHQMWPTEIDFDPWIGSGIPRGVEIAAQQIRQLARIAAHRNLRPRSGSCIRNWIGVDRHIGIECPLALRLNQFGGKRLRPLDDRFRTDHRPTRILRCDPRPARGPPHTDIHAHFQPQTVRLAHRKSK